mgnify:CR=1 FL=1
MRRLAAILFSLAAPALAVDVTTNDDWQAVVQTAAPTTTINFAAGTYATTGTALLVTNAGALLSGAGPGQSFLVAGAYSNSGVVWFSATNGVLSGFTVSGGNTTNFGGGVRGTANTLVTNCSIVSNYSKAGGGGTYGACVSDSLVAFNSSGDRCGGSQFVSSSFARNSVYSNNVAAGYAGAAGMAWADRRFGVLFTNCAIVANTQATWGAVSFGATLVDCALTGNRSVGASDVRPGAWGSYLDTGTASRCVFSFNSSPSEGGAVYGGRALDCLFVSNSAAYNGGAVCRGWASNCAFVGNVATQRGGAAWYGSFTNCVFSNNVAVGPSGGALYSPTESAFCRFYGNRANNYGGAVKGGTHKSGLFVSNWVAASGAGEGGGGASGYDLFLRSCLFDGNWAPSGRVQQVSVAHEAFNCTFVGGTNHGPAASIRTNSYLGRNCLSWGNVDNAIVYSTNLANCATNVDPEFLPGTFVPTAAGVVDAGDNTYADWGYDVRGSNRVAGGTVDLGAVERQDSDAEPQSFRRRSFFWSQLF